MERVLTDINADYGNRTLCCRSQGVLLVLAPLASLSLAGRSTAGPSHYRTTEQLLGLALKIALLFYKSFVR